MNRLKVMGRRAVEDGMPFSGRFGLTAKISQKDRAKFPAVVKADAVRRGYVLVGTRQKGQS